MATPDRRRTRPEHREQARRARRPDGGHHENRRRRQSHLHRRRSDRARRPRRASEEPRRRSRALARPRETPDHDGDPGAGGRWPRISRTSRCERTSSPGSRWRGSSSRNSPSRYEGVNAATYAEERWRDSTPEVALALKAAVAAGKTTDATWAKPLVNPAITDDFLPLLRAATILGKIAGLAESAVQRQRPSADGRRRGAVGRRTEAEARHARWPSRWKISASTKSRRSSC